MKISLIYPRISTAERYGVDIGEIGGRQAPLGILYLASYLKKDGHEIQMIDAEAECLSDDSVMMRLEEFKPQFAGISITTVAFGNAVRLAVRMRNDFTDVKIVAGGPHVTANLADAIRGTPFDFGIYGEGEGTFSELLGKSDQLAEISKLNGLIYRDGGGEINVNPPRTHIQDLDSLPHPDRDMLPDIRLYRPPIGCYKEDFVVSLMTSRGCPYRCVFCDNNTFGRKIRYFSHEYVVNEIEHVLKKYDARELTFVDDTFPSNRKRFVRILELIQQRGLKFSWTCMANVNDLDEELLRLMKKAGCWQIAVGIESGDDEILDIIKKGISTEKVRKTVNEADEIGILVKGFFMLGHPSETPETIEKTRRFALELPLTDIVCTIATPIKGTELYEMALSGKYGRFNAAADSSKFNYWEPVFVPNALTENELYSAQRRFYRTFYLRPQIILRQIGKIRNLKILMRTIAAAMKIMRVSSKAA